MSDTKTGFDAWLNGATITERSVVIVQDGSLAALWDDWVRRFDAAQTQTKEVGERSAGETSPVTKLYEEGATLIAQIEKSRTTWFVRGLQADVLKSIEKAHPRPPRTWERFSEPAPVAPENPTEVQAQAFLTAHALWEEQRAQYNDDTMPEFEAYRAALREVTIARGYERVARAFVRAEQGGAVVFAGLTADGARQVHAKIGDKEFEKLTAAIEQATNDEAPAPGESVFLSMVSETTRG